MKGFIEITIATSAEKRSVNVNEITSFNPTKSVGGWLVMGQNSFRVEESYEEIKELIQAAKL